MLLLAALDWHCLRKERQARGAEQCLAKEQQGRWDTREREERERGPGACTIRRLLRVLVSHEHVAPEGERLPLQSLRCEVGLRERGCDEQQQQQQQRCRREHRPSSRSGVGQGATATCSNELCVYPAGSRRRSVCATSSGPAEKLS